MTFEEAATSSKTLCLEINTDGNLQLKGAMITTTKFNVLCIAQTDSGAI